MIDQLKARGRLIENATTQRGSMTTIGGSFFGRFRPSGGSWCVKIRVYLIDTRGRGQFQLAAPDTKQKPWEVITWQVLY